MSRLKLKGRRLFHVSYSTKQHSFDTTNLDHTRGEAGARGDVGSKHHADRRFPMLAAVSFLYVIWLKIIDSLELGWVLLLLLFLFCYSCSP